MAIWYDGNLNLAENRRETDGVEWFTRGVRCVRGERHERYAVRTHFVERHEDLISLIRRYVLPLHQPGDVLAISEKVVAMCQGNVVERHEVSPGWWARFLSRLAANSPNGVGMNEPHKLQLAIDLRGLPTVLLAAAAGVAGKAIGVRGAFYRVVGSDIAGIDGFYRGSSVPRYHDLAVLQPDNPMGVCKKIEESLGVACIIADANDLAIDLLGYAPSLAARGESYLAELIADNPAGQDDEFTPFVLARDIGDAEAIPFTQVSARDDHGAVHAE
jgi:F420-0:gamma-glutamyl ligase